MTREPSGERPERDETPGRPAPEGTAPETSALEEDDLAGLPVEGLKAQVRKARDSAAQNWQHFLHSAADLENYKKQAARDRQDAVDQMRRQMLGLVLSVLDNLERALVFGDGHDGRSKALIEGLRITHRQILDKLTALGIHPIEAVGKKFDPHLHEAVSVIPPQDPSQKSGTVVSEVLRGYFLNDQVLRPAKVTVVAEQSSSTPAEEGGDRGS